MTLRLTIALSLTLMGCGAETQPAEDPDTITGSTDAGDENSTPSSGDVSPEERSVDNHNSGVDNLNPGPYQAGHRSLPFTYVTASTGEERTLLLHLWYPTEATEGEEAVYMNIFTDEGSIEGAPLAPPTVGDSYPVHVHSHGHLGYAGVSPFLMRHFATHGWVVAAPDHKGNTILDNLDPRPPWMYTIRLEDISATLDQLDDLPATDPLAGKLDTDPVVLSGHSFGGYTTFGVAGATFDPDHVASLCEAEETGSCEEGVAGLFEDGFVDPRVVAAISMAPGNYEMFSDAGLAAIAVPMLHMTGSDDHPTLNENIWAALTAPAARMEVEGGCHQLFALGGCDLIDDAVGLPIVNAYALAFARHHVLDDQSSLGLLDGSESLHEAVTYSVK